LDMNPKVAFVQVPKTGTVGIHILIGEKCVQIKHEPWTTLTAGEFRRSNPDAFIFAFLRNPVRQAKLGRTRKLKGVCLMN